MLQNAGGNDLMQCDRGRKITTRFTNEREDSQEAVNIGISDEEPTNEVKNIVHRKKGMKTMIWY